jgi:integrase
MASARNLTARRGQEAAPGWGYGVRATSRRRLDSDSPRSDVSVLVKVQEWLGHASVRATRVYDLIRLAPKAPQRLR